MVLLMISGTSHVQSISQSHSQIQKSQNGRPAGQSQSVYFTATQPSKPAGCKPLLGNAETSSTPGLDTQGQTGDKVGPYHTHMPRCSDACDSFLTASYHRGERVLCSRTLGTKTASFSIVLQTSLSLQTLLVTQTDLHGQQECKLDESSS